MTRTQLLGVSSLFFLMSSCSNHLEITLRNIQKAELHDFCPDFRLYSQIDTSLNFEANAVLCSFIGDQQEALSFATKDAINSTDYQLNFGLSDSQIEMFVSKQRETISDLNRSMEDRSEALKVIKALSRCKNLDIEFRSKTCVPATKFIIEKAREFHFMLINEAHYSAQNRVFVTNLLKPLWESGYKYLALETLDSSDYLINKRGYPLKKSGYYLKESAFGNMVREALRLGFKLVAYESISHDENMRDSLQAWNIYQKTYQTDSVGKVLVYAGYSHISESGDSRYKPMGYQLKKISGKEVFSVDQQTMLPLLNDLKVHPYYLSVNNHFHLKEPTVVIDEDGNPFLDPVNMFSVDLQVYHPKTIFVNNRPNWLILDKNQYPLPQFLLQNYEGYLLQVIKKEEPLDAVPIDQCVIHEKNNLVLTSGEYVFLIIDQLGTLKVRASVSID